ncbi:hypothetical protein DYB26_009792 [Aphanomyces astaci]|uniref:PX domain-containing protein n=2 Tax=Aphanomyces astaci TaxID=112090 RepID=A0A397EXZ5_APHAT|nr:hypothetical protein DYB26_009792 [Aphanomyces astaci]RHZ02124.1 hypothetical protein DYB31_011706 [Aphanomyces astaci]
MVVDQLRCAGVIAAIRISRAAFPNRLSLVEFAKRFDVICPSKLRHAAPAVMVMGLLEKLLGKTTDSTQNAKFAIGKSKVYFSSGLLQHLEDQRAVVLRTQATIIQAHMRGYAKRKQFLAHKAAAVLVQSVVRMHTSHRQFRVMKAGTVLLQTRVRGWVARRKFRVALAKDRQRKAELKRAAEAKARAEARARADAQAAAAAAARAEAEHNARSVAAAREQAEHNARPPASDAFKSSLIKEDEPVDTSSEGSDGDRLSAGSQSILASAASRVAEAEAAAMEAQKAAMAALTHNRVIQAENEALRAKMAAYVSEHADAELLRENERLKHQVLTLQSKLVRAQEVSLISAKVVDSRMTFREGRQFVEYKLQIETNNRGTLFVWHRYSTFRNLATTLQTKNGYRRKDIPDLPNKQMFNNFSDKLIQERVDKLNQFLEAATMTDYLQWGIRVDQDTCVYKRRTRSSSDGRDSMAGPPRESMAVTMYDDDSARDSMAPTSSSTSSTSSRESFSLRQSFSRTFGKK